MLIEVRFHPPPIPPIVEDLLARSIPGPHLTSLDTPLRDLGREVLDPLLLEDKDQSFEFSKTCDPVFKTFERVRLHLVSDGEWGNRLCGAAQVASPDLVDIDIRLFVFVKAFPTFGKCLFPTTRFLFETHIKVLNILMLREIRFQDRFECFVHLVVYCG